MATTKQKRPHGRATRSKPRSERLEVRLTREQKRLLERGSAREGKTLSAFVIESALQAANEESVLRLSPRDSMLVLDLLASPPRKPTETALRAVERYRRMFKKT